LWARFLWAYLDPNTRCTLEPIGGGGLRGVGVRFTDFGRFGLLGRVFFLWFCLPNLLIGGCCVVAGYGRTVLNGP